MLKLSRLLITYKTLKLDINKFATVIKMPSLSPTMNEGGIVEWHKKEGDKISAGDLMCDIQTDKAVVGMEAEEDGVLAKILKPKDSQNIKVGDPIGMMADIGEDWKSVTIISDTKVDSTVSPPVVSVKPESKLEKSSQKLGPAVRRLLDTYGLESDKISHSGPHNILTKSDVLQFIDNSKLSPADQLKELKPAKILSKVQQTSSFVDVPLTNMRQTISKRMSASKSSIPHINFTGEASLDLLIKTRKQLKQEGISLSVNDFVVKACGLALRMVPNVNNSYNSDGTIQQNKTVDISVAVATDRGLITPIVFGADKLSVCAINSSVRALADKAHSNKLLPHEFMGGTFTISNLGMFGIKEFTAIINTPQAAILAVGAAIPQVGFDHTNPTKPKSETKMRFTLCADARIVDSTSAAEFIHHVKTFLENPNILLSDQQLSSAENASEAWTY